jgi:hypothetical protein
VRTGTPRDHSIPWRSALLVTVVTSFLLGGMLVWYSTLQGAGLVGFGFSRLYALVWHCRRSTGSTQEDPESNG